jgi:hypothetical protein
VAATTIDCAGATEPNALVQVNGQPVEVRNSRFLASVPLPTVGDNVVRVVASSPGKAPRTTEVHVRRVESLRAELERFARSSDASLTYAKLAANPAMYAGRPVVMHGRIFNLHTERGQTDMQIAVVRDCPAGAKCTVWVTLHGETDAQFCARKGKNCGRVTGTDLCDLSRSAECGSCASPSTSIAN